jgi:hypothetical protein
VLPTTCPECVFCVTLKGVDAIVTKTTSTDGLPIAFNVGFPRMSFDPLVWTANRGDEFWLIDERHVHWSTFDSKRRYWHKRMSTLHRMLFFTTKSIEII